MTVWGAAGRIWVVAFSACAAGALSTQTPATPAPIADDEDERVAKLAEAAVESRCADTFHGEFDEQDGRDSLLAVVGGNNWLIEDVLKKAEGSDDIGEKFTQYFENEGSGLVARKAAGLVLFIFSLLVFPCFCFTLCCPKCRICTAKQEVETKLPFKVCGIILALCLGFGIVMCWIFAARAGQKMSDGVENLGCTSAKLVDTVLSGQDNPSFIGLKVMVSDFEALSSTLDSDSQFVTEFNTIIDETVELDNAVNFVESTLNLLVDMMAANKNPGGSHSCIACTDISDSLTPVIDLLGDSLATTLKAARAEAKNQLNEDGREDMKGLLSAAIQPIREMKNNIRDFLKPLVEEENWNSIQESEDLVGMIGQYAFFIVAFVFGIFAAVAMLWFFLKEKNGPSYSRVPDRCSTCVWCCAPFLVLVCFLIGGLLELIAFPVSTICLTVDDLSGTLINDIQAALEIDSSGDGLEMLKNAVDLCINPEDPNVAANFADILFTTNETDDSRITMREQLGQQVNGQITGRFDKIDLQAGSSLADSSVALTLKTTLTDLGPQMDALIITDKDRFTEELTKELTTPPDGTWPGWFTTVRCDDFEDLPNGIVSFLDSEQQNGATLGFPKCSRGPVVGGLCPGVAQDENQCSAAVNLLTRKNTVVSDAVFRCDVFQRADGTECEVRADDWSSCMNSEGAFVRKEKACSLDEFKQYIEAFSDRIDFALATVDDSTTRLADQVSTDLLDLLHKHVLDPITEIIDGAQCNFIGKYYQEMVWGMCYQGAVGLSTLGTTYVALGVLTTVLIFVMYALWRRTVDNVRVHRNNPAANEPSSSQQQLKNEPAASGAEGEFVC